MGNIPAKLGEVLFRVVEGDKTAARIGKSTGTRHSTVMEHLSKLEGMRLVHGEKKGRERLYSVDWEELLNAFSQNFAEGENNVTETFSELAYPSKTIGRLPIMSGTSTIARKFEDKKYLKTRPRLIADVKKLMLENRLVRDLLKTYLKAYSYLAWTKDDTSLNACVLAFVDRFALILNQNPDVRKFLKKKTKAVEMRGFVRFLRFLAEDAYVGLPSEVVCVDRMRDFLMKVLSRE